MQFNIIASTGRTATTFIAASLNSQDGVAATHEGYLGADKSTDPVIPLINLENRSAFASLDASISVAQAKRSPDIINMAEVPAGSNTLIDVAYYNATLTYGILHENKSVRMIGIVRDCEPFVRSCTCIEGEDLLPVGWPALDKPLSDREKFIGMGRVRPSRGDADFIAWKTWSAIRRNIWLWRETNVRLAHCKDAFPDRVKLIDFETLKGDPNAFWESISSFFDTPLFQPNPHLKSDFINKKVSGYQIGPSSEWQEDERAALSAAMDGGLTNVSSPASPR